MSNGLKIGVVGARGIGKHHAKWFARAGCEVTAIYGTSQASAEAAAAVLCEMFGFDGRVFHQWDRFRREGGFEACSIASPMEDHLANVRDLAADGKHLLCEKPLLWDWTHDSQRLLSAAAELVGATEKAGVILAVSAQYPMLLAGFAALHRDVLGREPEHRALHFVMETKGAPRSEHGPAEAWVDLGPHALAVVDLLAPGGIQWETLRHADGPSEAVLDFEWVSGARRLPVHLETRRITGGAIRRELGNQDLVAAYEGCTVAGDFAARLRGGGKEWVGPDPMRMTIARFVEAVRLSDPSRVVVSGQAALRQQGSLVGVWEHCWAGRETS